MAAASVRPLETGQHAAPFCLHGGAGAYTGGHRAAQPRLLPRPPEGRLMPRTPRRWQWTEAACYHVMDRGHNRETIFADDEDRRHFLKLLARYRDRFDLRLYHYCLMGNHFHVLVQLGEARRLSALMAGLLRSYTHHFHRRHGFVGRLWQGRFKAPAIEAEGYLLSCGRYVERNPAEARLVALPWEYGWSSC